MANLAFTLGKGQVLDLTASPQDDSNEPASLPGPVSWVLADTALGTLTPSTDEFSLQSQFVPQPGKQGKTTITASDPAAPTIPSVEVDVTVTFPPATHLVIAGQVS